MRITFVNSLYRGGGAERCARELFERERAAGHETRMFVARRTGGEPDGVVAVRRRWEKYLRPLAWLGVPDHVRHVGSARTLARSPAAGHADVVHLHNLHGGWLSLPAVRRWTDAVPTVWTLHDEWLPSGGLGYDLARVMGEAEIERWFGRLPGVSSRQPGAAARRAYVYRWAPRPAAVIVPSRYLESLARGCEVLAGVPVHHVPNGLTMLERPEIDAGRAACRQAFGIEPGARVVLLLAANLSSPFKGTPLGIEALRRLGGVGGAGGADVTVLIVGEREAGVDWAGVPRPVFAGFVRDEGRLAQAYRAADVTLLPSVADNLPYVALESLACGTPLATFRVGGLTEIVGEGGRRGLAAAPFDTGELAGNIAALLSDADRRRALGEAGRRWVEENCSMDAFVSANLAVYQEAVDRWHGGGGGGVNGNGSRAATAVAAVTGAPNHEGRP